MTPKRLALILLALIAAPALRAAERPWQQTLLVDWYYPGEEAYEALKSAAAAAGNHDWVAQRMAAGERIPQASARELAFKLSESSSDPAVNEKLKRLLADEPELLRDKGDDSAAAEAASIAKEFDRTSARMDAMEALLELNHYGKGSFPAINFDADAGYQFENAAGLLSGRTRGYATGGLNITFRGTLDKANYVLSLGIRYVDHEDDVSAAPYTKRESMTGNGFSFLLPLGEGGLEVHLGDSVDMKLSPLIFSGIDVANRDAYFVDTTIAFRPHADVKELELNYPYATVSRRGFAIKKQGAVWYWPFSITQFDYSPDNQFWEVWSTKINTWAMRLDEDFGSHGYIISKSNLYGVAMNAENDEDELRPVSLLPIQHANAFALGGELGFDSGASLKGEYAVSHYEREGTVFEESDNGSAWIANLTLPLGPIYTGFEAGAASPKFVTRDRPPIPGVNGALDRLQSGATYDTSSFNPFPGAPAGAANYTWQSFLKDPTVMANNTNRYAVKAEWHSSWVSLGLYDGIIGQIEATGPFVTTSPYIEGKSLNGYAWFRMFGQNYAYPPLPGATAPTTKDGLYYLWLYNHVTDGNAKYDSSGGLQQVHWQELAQYSYREGQYTVLLNKKGPGDMQILDDSVKTINYMGGTLRFDFKALLNRELPLHLIVVGEDRDLAMNPGLPAFDASNLFNQTYTVGFLTCGLTEEINFVGTLGYETWKTQQSYFPVNIQTHEYGGGFDLKLDPLLTGLEVNLRSTLTTHEDLNIDARAFSLWTLSIGSTLTY